MDKGTLYGKVHQFFLLASATLVKTTCKRGTPLLLTFILVGTISEADAALIDSGGGLIYDSTQNITWLQDANYCASNPDPNCVGSNTFAVGAMNWSDATNWADNLVFGGYDDWRLPTTVQPDPTCSTQSPAGSFEFNCTGSELGYLFNEDNITAASSGLFSNVEAFFYWSDTEFSLPTAAWSFSFDIGYQTVFDKDTIEMFAWAVRDGNVASVPVPGTMILVTSGLLGLLGFARRSRQQRQEPTPIGQP